MKKNEKRIKELKSLIDKYNKYYYEKSESLVTDYEYDALKKELLNLTKTELFNEQEILSVGYTPSSRFKKRNHILPMLSLSNINNEEELSLFIKKIQRFLDLNEENIPEISCELKIDGLSFSAIYKNGKLDYALTRGDGEVGEDITENIKTISQFPIEVEALKNCNVFEIRGEIFMPKSVFIELKDEMKFSNPRNAASGSLRQLDSNIVKLRKLSYFIYSCHNHSSDIIIPDNHHNRLDFLSAFFQVNKERILTSKVDEILNYFKKINEIRYLFDYDLDGIVLKINNINLQNRLDSTSHSPRWACAFKFNALYAKTKIVDIVNQIGRTGIITPVAILEPINIGGVIVSRATLHNYEEIKKKNIKLFDIVILNRAGDVIPYIQEVDFSSRNGNEIDINKPIFCPSCNSNLMKEEIFIKCINLACKEKKLQQLIHFCSKDGLNINGLGHRQLEKFFNIGLINSFKDIFSLKEKKDYILTLEGFKNKSFENLITAIEFSRVVLLDKFIYALGILNIGEVAARTIAEEFATFQNILKCEDIKNKLEKIDNFGNVAANNFAEFIKTDKEELIILSQILNVVDFKVEKKFFFGKKIIFTGMLEKYSRSEIKNIAIKLGFKVLSSISKDLDFLIYGKEAGVKLKNAKELAIKCLNEDEFFNLIKSF